MLALSACAGAAPRPLEPRSFFEPAIGPPAPPLPLAEAEPAPEARRAVAGRVETHVAARMPGQSAAARGRLTSAILSESERARFDPLLVLAVIHVESSFSPRAVSSAGAVGLMQLSEPTMRGEAARSGLPSANRWDPVANVRAGVRYLRRLFDTFGDLDVALMAYNAGPARIRKEQLRGALSERYRVYARRVRAELSRLRSRFGLAPGRAEEAAEEPGPAPAAPWAP